MNDIEANVETVEEDTTPAAETTDTETSTADDANTNADSEQSTISESGNGEGTAEDDGTNGNEDIALSVVFDHKSKELSHDDAVRYAQLGMLHEKQQILYDKLGILAAEGDKTLTEYVNEAFESAEQRIKNECRERAGDDEDMYQQLLTLAHSRQKSKYDAILQAERDKEKAAYEKDVERVADEFRALQKDIPELKNFEDIPKGAVALAERENMTLREAYLLYAHREQAAVTAAQKAAEKAAESSTGSVHSEQGQHDGFDDLLKGIWS